MGYQLANKHLNGRFVVCHSHAVKAALHAINRSHLSNTTHERKCGSSRFDHRKQSFTIKDIINDFYNYAMYGFYLYIFPYFSHTNDR